MGQMATYFRQVHDIQLLHMSWTTTKLRILFQMNRLESQTRKFVENRLLNILFHMMEYSTV